MSGEPRGALAMAGDLLVRSRIEAALKPAGLPVRFVREGQLACVLREETPALLLFDFSACEPADLEAIRSLRALAVGPRPLVIAYGPHLDLAARDRARPLADEVLPNSQIAARLPVIARRLSGAGSTTLRLGHSPDPDDAFMFYPIACGKMDTEDLRFEQILQDIETLNRMALEGEIEITAASVHAYAHLSRRYAILPCGGSFGDGYGPLLVSRSPLARDDLAGRVVAIPGALTSACLALRLFAGDVRSVVVPFDRIPDYVLEGKADVGLLIHEGQLTYAAAGLHKVADLGEWWKTETGLPLPLGVNIIRKDLGAQRCGQVARLLKSAISYALAHRPEALAYALQFGRGLREDLADRFVGMYVNDLTLETESAGRQAIALFLQRGFETGILPRAVEPEFVTY